MTIKFLIVSIGGGGGGGGCRAMVFNTIFNNNSAMSWKSVLLVEEIGVPGENHTPAASH